MMDSQPHCALSSGEKYEERHWIPTDSFLDLPLLESDVQIAEEVVDWVP
jgi:hypothetical protein